MSAPQSALELAVHERGTPTPGRAPAVLLHGLGGSAEDWRPQLEALGPERRCLALDLAGHGDSPRLRQRRRIPEHARDVAAALEARGMGEPVHLVGVSLGSMVALELGAARPELVRSVCALSSFHDTRRRSLAAWRFFLSRWVPMRLFGPRRLAELLGPRLFPEPGQDALRSRFVNAWARNDARSYRLCFEGSFGWTLDGREAELRAPALFLRGARDYFPRSPLAEFVARVSDARLVDVPNAGHALPAERPLEALAHLRPFLAAHDGYRSSTGT